MPEHDDLLADLGELGRSVPTPSAAGMDEAVLARLAPTAGTTSRPRWLLRAAAIAVAALLALLLIPPVRAAVADWFGFGSVVVREGDGTGELPTVSPTPSGPGTSLGEAASQVTSRSSSCRPSASLAAPGCHPTGGSSRSCGTTGRDSTSPSSRSYTFAKSAETFEHVSVDGRDALWFPDSHQVAVLDEQGREVVETRRRVGSTLVWMVGDTTLRLEGELTLQQAVDVAESARAYE